MDEKQQASIDRQGILIAGMKACLMSIGANVSEDGLFSPEKENLLRQAYDRLLEAMEAN